MAQIPVKDASGSTVNVELPLAPGRALAAASRPVVLSSEDFARLASLETAYHEAATAFRMFFVDVTGVPLVSDPEAHLGNLGGHTPHVEQTLIRAASATQYTAGDRIAPAGTNPAAMEFTGVRNLLADSNRSGRLTGVSCVQKAASGTIVFPNFALLLFRPVTDIPFAAASMPDDNAAMSLTDAAMQQCIARLEFSATGWVNHLGAATAAGTVGFQTAGPTKRPYAPFNLAGLGEVDLLGIVQDLGGWNPGNVANTFHFRLDIDQD